MAFIEHTLEPVFDGRSRILILGTMPSPKSREFGFYYGHPQNIFWQTLAQVLHCAPPAVTVAARRAFVLQQGIALWDVLKSCQIEGAADSSIRQEIANDLRPLLAAAPIAAIFTTGKQATALFARHCAPLVQRESIYLPSTSPANRAAQKAPEFLEQWQQIQDYL